MRKEERTRKREGKGSGGRERGGDETEERRGGGEDISHLMSYSPEGSSGQGWAGPKPAA